MANEWKLTEPTDDELVPDLPSEHRQRKTNTAAVLQKEHATLGDGNSGGEHKPGSAVAWYLATGSIPALDVEGNALASTDNGRLWLDSTTKIFYALDDYQDPTVGNGWVAMGHLLGDIAINTDKFTVARATGNTVIAGTLAVTGAAEVTGVATLGNGSLTKTSTAPTTDAMIANKKYVDDKRPFIDTFDGATKSWKKDSEGNAILEDHDYLAPCDGFFFGFSDTGSQNVTVMVGISANLSSTDDEIFTIHTGGSTGRANWNIPVPSGSYFKVTCGATLDSAGFMGIGSASRPVDQD